MRSTTAQSTIDQMRLWFAAYGLPTHKEVHDELVYRVEFEGNNPELSGFQDATVKEI